MISLKPSRTDRYEIYIDNLCIGRVHLTPSEKWVETLHIWDFFIDNEHRCKGYGEQTVVLIADIARSSGYKRLGLRVELDNPRAIKFYEKCGFRFEGMPWKGSRPMLKTLSE